MSDTSEKAGDRHLARGVLIRAIRDLGGGGEAEVPGIVSFVFSDSFESMCGDADWDPSWLRDVFKSMIGMAREARETRMSVAKEVAHLLSKMEEQE